MIIEFIPSNKTVSDNVPLPESAKAALPQWYKDAPTAGTRLSPIISQEGNIVKGLKSCTPFVDALTSGYIQKTWCDIHIEFNNGEFNYHCGQDPVIMEHRDKVNTKITDRFYPIEFAWLMPWIPKLPKGYSILCTHPHNRLDLPFTALTGIIDCDEFYHVGFGKFPFYIEKGFTGTIPAGTPMFQMTPFKRDSWESKKINFEEKVQTKREYTYLREFYNVYKNKFWQKKSYR